MPSTHRAPRPRATATSLYSGLSIGGAGFFRNGRAVGVVGRASLDGANGEVRGGDAGGVGRQGHAQGEKEEEEEMEQGAAAAAATASGDGGCAAAAPCGVACARCKDGLSEREASLAAREAALRAREIELEVEERHVAAERAFLVTQRKALEAGDAAELLLLVVGCVAHAALEESHRPKIETARCSAHELAVHNGTCKYMRDVEVMTQLRLEAEARRRERSQATHRILSDLWEY